MTHRNDGRLEGWKDGRVEGRKGGRSADSFDFNSTVLRDRGSEK